MNESRVSPTARSYGEPARRLRDGGAEDADDAAELPDALQEQPQAPADRLHGGVVLLVCVVVGSVGSRFGRGARCQAARHRRPGRSGLRGQEEAQHTVRRGHGLLLSQGPRLHLRAFTGKTRRRASSIFRHWGLCLFSTKDRVISSSVLGSCGDSGYFIGV